MTWSVVVPDIVAGLFLGAFLALVAVGYSMVYGILRLINFAHGDFYMVSAFVSYTLLAAVTVGTKINWGNVVWVGIVTMVAGGVLAMSVERLVYRPMRRAAVLSVMIAALGVSQVLENGVLNIPGLGLKLPPLPGDPAWHRFQRGQRPLHLDAGGHRRYCRRARHGGVVDRQPHDAGYRHARRRPRPRRGHVDGHQR